MHISDIAAKTGLAVECLRDGEFDAVALLGLRKDESQKHISYILDMKYLDNVVADGVGCVIAPPATKGQIEEAFDGGILIAEDPKTTFFEVHATLSAEETHQPSVIAASATIAPTAVIPDQDITIGENVVIEDNVVLQGKVTIGDGTIVMANTTIGTPAFYYYGDGDGKKMVKSTGSVEIGKNAFIHANVVICRGVIGGPTIVGDNTSLDSNVFLGHDVQIARNTIVAASTSFGGWVEVGEGCFFGVGGKVAPMKKVGNHVDVNIGAVITTNVADGMVMSGNFAIEHDKFIDNLKKSTK